MFQTPTLPESELELTFTKTYLGRCHLEPFYPSAQFDKEPPGQRMLVLRVDPEHRSGQASRETRSISKIYFKEYSILFFFFFSLARIRRMERKYGRDRSGVEKGGERLGRKGKREG